MAEWMAMDAPLVHAEEEGGAGCQTFGGYVHTPYKDIEHLFRYLGVGASANVAGTKESADGRNGGQSQKKGGKRAGGGDAASSAAASSTAAALLSREKAGGDGASTMGTQFQHRPATLGGDDQSADATSSRPTSVAEAAAYPLYNSDVVMDLGCGDGRACIVAAGPAFRVRGVGIDIDHDLVVKFQAKTDTLGLSDRVLCVRGDATDPLTLLLPSSALGEGLGNARDLPYEHRSTVNEYFGTTHPQRTEAFLQSAASLELPAHLIAAQQTKHSANTAPAVTRAAPAQPPVLTTTALATHENLLQQVQELQAPSAIPQPVAALDGTPAPAPTLLSEAPTAVQLAAAEAVAMAPPPPVPLLGNLTVVFLYVLEHRLKLLFPCLRQLKALYPHLIFATAFPFTPVRKPFPSRRGRVLPCPPPVPTAAESAAHRSNNDTGKEEDGSEERFFGPYDVYTPPHSGKGTARLCFYIYDNVPLPSEQYP